MNQYSGGEYPTGGDESRYQAISQYSYQPPMPVQMSIADQFRIATQPRFQYGVPGGQDVRHYQRRAEMDRFTTHRTIGQVAANTAGYSATWSAGAISGAAMGTVVGGPLGTIVGATAGLLGGVVSGHFVNQGANNSLMRQKLMHSNAMDIEQYRSQAGFSGGLSYNQASSLGSQLAGNMTKPGEFFSADQQMRMHKIGLSNNMLDARGGGKMSGTTGQYTKNFKELKETTELVVKTLKTTLEGGMSVINELKNSGFTSFAQIKNQIKQAAAIGNVTGMGTSNTMLLGAAGAQAVQGTGWNASAGAAMYQSGGVQAATMAKGSSAGAYAVQRAGGVAQAGATIANAQMNILMNSSFGTRMAAYAMSGDGSVNAKKMDKLLQGKESAYGVVMGSASTGFAMGTSRVRFPFMKEDFYNNMNEQTRTSMSMEAFNLWRSQRGGSDKDQAAVFAGMFTQNTRDKRLMSEWLLSKDKGWGAVQQSMRADDMTGRAIIKQAPSVARMIGQTAPFRAATEAGEAVVNAASDASSYIGGAGSSIKTAYRGALADLTEAAMIKAGVVGPEGYINRSRPGDREQAARRLYGLEDTNTDAFTGASSADKARISAQFSGINNGVVKLKSGKSLVMYDAAKRAINSGMSNKETQSAMDNLSAMIANETLGGAFKDPVIEKLMGRAGISEQTFMQNKSQIAAGLVRALPTADQNIRTRFKYLAADGEARIQQIEKHDPQRGAKERSDLARAVELQNRVNNEYASGIPNPTDKRAKDYWTTVNELNSFSPDTRKHAGILTKGPKGDPLRGTGDVDILARADEIKKQTSDAVAGALGLKKAGFGMFRKEDEMFKGASKEARAAAREIGADLTTRAGVNEFNRKAVALREETQAGDFDISGRSDADKKMYKFLQRQTREQLDTMEKGVKDEDMTSGLAARLQRVSTVLSTKGGKGRDVGEGGSAILNKLASGEMTADEAYKAMDKKDLNILEKDKLGAGTGIKSGADLTEALFSKQEMEKQKESETQKKLTGDISAAVADQKKLLSENWTGTKKQIEQSSRNELLIKNLERELESDKAINKANETEAGRSLSSIMTPPVLNYWNNRWVL